MDTIANQGAASLLIILSAVLLLPLIPAWVLYRFLPARTSVTGPFKGLNVKLSGAFSGYFLLVLIALGLAYAVTGSAADTNTAALAAENQALRARLDSLQEWEMEGAVETDAPSETRVFVAGKSTEFLSTGRFTVRMLVEKGANGRPKLPLALCFYHKANGYKVLNLDTTFSQDRKLFGVQVNDSSRHILIRKSITLKKWCPKPVVAAR
jgi:hypothetical protein